MNEHLYNVYLKCVSDRNGIISSPELDLAFNVATPPQFPKGVEGVWSPEHFFTAAVNSCFMTTFLAIAEYSKLDFENFDCNAEGILDKVEGKFLMTEINLNAKLKIIDISKAERAERILHKSEEACLISNSIKTKVNLTCAIS